jgi:hypothetical protein
MDIQKMARGQLARADRQLNGVRAMVGAPGVDTAAIEAWVAAAERDVAVLRMLVESGRLTHGAPSPPPG